MAILIIPTATDPDRSQETTLDGRPYLFRFRWNERSAAWFMDLHTIAGGPILVSARLSLSTRPLLGVLHADRPPGELVVVDRAGTGVEPSQDDFGGRVQLMYVEATS